MEQFGKHIRSEGEIDRSAAAPPRHFEPFKKTYPYVAFAMFINNMYPNPATEKRRIIAIPLTWLVISPCYIIICIDIYHCWQVNDIDKVFAHTIIIGPFTATFLKMALIFYKRREARRILDEINQDHSVCNNLTSEYQTILGKWIKFMQFYEKFWNACSFIGSFCFHFMAIGMMIYSALFTEKFTKYMVHDINLPFGEPEKRLEFPYFEFFFIQTTLIGCIYYANFTGYDGFLVLSIIHSCSKIELCAQALVDAVKVEDDRLRIKQLGYVIMEQNRLYRYVELVTDTFQGWLSTIATCMVVHLCTCAYHLSKNSFDVHFMAATGSSCFYVFTLCASAGIMKETAAKLSSDLYCCGWEHVTDVRVRKMVQFMIARAQIPLKIMAMGLYDFDVELFTRMMKMAYTMFTLLQQTN
uniref:Odorant receptor n=1 Tax=Heortia vitessoides TaxID=1557813 RepID=A0A978W727_9NEOP|nr:odorant receptor 30 [Heortia vitessoides]